MEYLDNEGEKGIYWIILFIIIIVMALIGYYYVFYDAVDSKNENKIAEEEETYDLTDYIGVWQLYMESDEYPEEELHIEVVDGSTITFNYYIADVAYFESGVANIDENENSANFEITDRTGEINLKGRMTLKNNLVYLSITSSNLESISTGTIIFENKSDTSLLNVGD